MLTDRLATSPKQHNHPELQTKNPTLTTPAISCSSHQWSTTQTHKLAYTDHSRLQLPTRGPGEGRQSNQVWLAIKGWDKASPTMEVLKSWHGALQWHGGKLYPATKIMDSNKTTNWLGLTRGSSVPYEFRI